MKKKCSCCQIEKDFSEFNIDKSRKFGLGKYCRKCISEKYLENREKNIERMRKHYKRNKKKMLEANKQWRDAHPEQVKISKKRYYQLTRDERLAYSKEWYYANKKRVLRNVKKYTKEHPEIKRKSFNRVRARNSHVIYENVDLNAIYAKDNYTCQRCHKSELKGRDLTIDHIIPISKGGPHIASNLQVLCRSCNASKGNR